MRRALLALVLLAGLAGTARAATTYYISPSGNDSNPCSLAQPCLTIAHAQTVAQAARASGTIDVAVYAREGTYQPATGLTYGPADSGSVGHPVVYASYPGEHAVISGGMPILTWSLYSGSIYRADVSTASHTVSATTTVTVTGTHTATSTSTLTNFGLYYFLITPTSGTNQDLFYDLSLAPAGFWAHVKSDGGDIRVTLSDQATQVAREVSAFNQGAQTGALYINTNGGTATSFYVFYGSGAAEPSASSTYGKYNTWETAAKLVAHLENMTDSTQYQNNGSSAHPPSYVAGQVENAGSFNGSNQTISLTSSASLNAPTAAITLSAWIKPTSYVTGFIVGKGYMDQYDMYMNSSGYIDLRLPGVASYPDTTTTSAVSTTDWTLVTGTWDGAHTVVYYNGGSMASNADTGTISTSAEAATINSRAGGDLFFPGKIDEVRIYNRALSATEVSNMYANQHTPVGFWTTGAEVTSAGVVTATNTATATATTSSTALNTFRQLYVNGTHAQRARGALNPTGWTATAGGYTMPDSSMASWGNPTNIEIVSLGDWTIDRCKVATIVGTALTVSTPCWTIQEATGLAIAHIRATPSWVENAYELLAAGYWYLDTAANYLYYQPASGTMSGVTVVAPQVANPLTIASAQYLTFKNLVFAYSNWTGPDTTTGYVEEQSGYTWTSTSPSYNVSDVGKHAIRDAAATVTGSVGITFDHDQFSHLGSGALLLTGGNATMTITNNRFDDIAGGELQIGDADGCPGAPESGVTVTGNTFNGGSFDYWGHGAVFAPCMANSTISNNTISHTRWSGVAVGWGWAWGSPYTYTSNNVIEDNSIGYCESFPDCGCVYTNGSEAVSYPNGPYALGLTVSGNVCVGKGNANCLYPDNSSRWGTWAGNVCQNPLMWTQIYGTSILNQQLVGNYTDTASYNNTGAASCTISGTTLIPTGAQPFGTAAQAIICAAGVPGATGCTTPTLWPTWQSGVGATWTRPQVGP